MGYLTLLLQVSLLHSREWDGKVIVCEKVIKGLKVSVDIDLKVFFLLLPVGIEKKKWKNEPGNVMYIRTGDILSLLLQRYCFTNLNCNTAPWHGSVPWYCAVYSDGSLEFSIKAKIPRVQYLAWTEIVTDGRAL